MTGRRQNNFNARGNYSNFKTPGTQNQQNIHRYGGAVGTKSNNFLNQVNPWLPQSNSSGLGNLGRNISSDPQAQLALASNLINNLLGSDSPLSKFSQPPSLLTLGNTSSSYGGPSFSRDRFGIPRSSMGKIQKRGDFKNFGKNKRFGNDRKNQGTQKDQTNKKVTGEQTAEKKDIDKNEENKVENNDLNQAVSEKEDEADSSTVHVGKKDNEKSTEDEVKVSYNEIPFALLYCHICRKHMWDDVSFEKHLEGKPHKLMVDELERSYDLKVELLRHEMRVMEQQRENDIQRAFRKGKSKVKLQQRDFCAMCNLNFLGLLPAHRKNERHQRLKKFLHPKCSACVKEFYTRLEWDEHKLSAAHLKKLAEIIKETRPDLENSEFDIIDFIEDINDEFEAEIMEVKVSGKRETMDELCAPKSESGEKSESIEFDSELRKNPEDGNVEKDENEKEEKAEDDEETKRLPKYIPGNPVGENFLVDKKGYLCRACNRFMLNREDNKIHCQTIIHYNNIIKILKAQNKINSNKKRQNTSKNDNETAVNNSNDENECKRQKLDESALADNEPDYKMQIEDERPPGTESEEYDPEKSDSECEIDNEFKPSDTTKYMEVPRKDMKTDVVVNLPRIKDDPKGFVKEEKQTSRTPRARRGRRN